MRLYLVRHGETLANVRRQYNPDDDALTERGAAQARAARPFFDSLSYDQAFTSPLPRAQHTATLLGLSATVVDALADHKFGAFAGSPWGTIREQASSLGLPREQYVPPGGESILDARHRVVDFVEHLPDGVYVLVVHAGTIIDLVHALTGRAWAGIHVENVAVWVLENGHVLHENWRPWQDNQSSAPAGK